MLTPRWFCAIPPPELGIDLPHVYRKTLSVLNPLKVDERLMDDGDLTGPMLFCLMMATCHLLVRAVSVCGGREEGAV